MSLSLLRALQGTSSGAFAQYVNAYERMGRAPRIAWYPSAGEDFRALLFLNPQYPSIHPATEPELPAPELFLFTDYFPWRDAQFLDNSVVHCDARTVVRITHIERLPDQRLPLNPEIVHFPEGSKATGVSVYMEVEAVSTVLGTATWPVLYSFCENEAFCAHRLLPCAARISHVIHVRYGGGLGGGGRASGAWLPGVLNRLGCDMFITDDHLHEQSGDRAAVSIYPALASTGALPRLRPIRRIPGEQWSNHGDVNWYRLDSSNE